MAYQIQSGAIRRAQTYGHHNWIKSGKCFGAGHVARMGDDRLPKKICQGEVSGRRPRRKTPQKLGKEPKRDYPAPYRSECWDWWDLAQLQSGMDFHSVNSKGHYPGVLTENTDDFIIGDRVWVGGTKPGYIQFIGDTKFAPGEWAGIVLDEPIGKNDGSLGGIRYFMCEPKRGVFSRLTKLTRDGASTESGHRSSPKSSILSDGEDVQTRRVSSPTNGVVTTTRRALSPTDGVTRTTRQSKRVTSSPNTGGQVLTSSTTTTVKHDALPASSGNVRIGDRILVGGTKAGVLRYMGTTDFATGQWCGVELDEPLGKNDGTVAGKKYFDCKTKYGLFAPIHKVSKQPGSSTVTRVVRTTRVAGNSPTSSLHKRSGSRESLGSMSTTSQHSTSGTRKSGRPQAANVSATNTALQETLREKEQHIDQLLKEREMERSEVAQAAAQVEAVTKPSSLVNSTNRSVATTISSNKFYSYNVVMVIQTIVKVHYMTVFLTFHRLYRPKLFLTQGNEKLESSSQFSKTEIKSKSKKSLKQNVKEFKNESILNTKNCSKKFDMELEGSLRSKVNSKLNSIELENMSEQQEKSVKNSINDSTSQFSRVKKENIRRKLEERPQEREKYINSKLSETKKLTDENLDHILEKSVIDSSVHSKQNHMKIKKEITVEKGSNSDVIADSQNKSEKTSKQSAKKIVHETKFRESLKECNSNSAVTAESSKKYSDKKVEPEYKAKNVKSDSINKISQISEIHTHNVSFKTQSLACENESVGRSEVVDSQDRTSPELLAVVHKEIYSNTKLKPKSKKLKSKSKNISTIKKGNQNNIEDVSSSHSKVVHHTSILKRKDSDSDSDNKTVRFNFNDKNNLDKSNSLSETEETKTHHVEELVQQFENITTSDEFRIFEPIKKSDFSSIIKSCREKAKLSSDKPEVKFGVQVLPVDDIDGKVNFRSFEEVQSNSKIETMENESNSFVKSSKEEHDKITFNDFESDSLTYDDHGESEPNRTGGSMNNNNREVEMPDDVEIFDLTSSAASIPPSDRNERLVSAVERSAKETEIHSEKIDSSLRDKSVKIKKTKAVLSSPLIKNNMNKTNSKMLTVSDSKSDSLTYDDHDGRNPNRAGRSMNNNIREVEMPDGVEVFDTTHSDAVSISPSDRSERLVSAVGRSAKEREIHSNKIDSSQRAKSVKRRKTKTVLSSPLIKSNINKNNLKKVAIKKIDKEKSKIEKLKKNLNNSDEIVQSSQCKIENLKVPETETCSKHTCPKHGMINVKSETIKSTELQNRKNKVAMEYEMNMTSPIIMRTKSHKLRKSGAHRVTTIKIKPNTSAKIKTLNVPKESQLASLQVDYESLGNEKSTHIEELKAFLDKETRAKQELLSQLEDEKRKVEDLEFRLEEEALCKGDDEFASNENKIKFLELEQELEKERQKSAQLETQSKPEVTNEQKTDIIHIKSSLEQEKLKSSQLEDMCKQLKADNSTNLGKEDELRRFRNEVEILRKQLEEAHGKIVNLEMGAKSRNGRNSPSKMNDIEKEVAIKDDTILQLQVSFDHKKKEVSELQLRIAEMERELDTTKKRNQRQQEIIDNLNIRLTSNENSSSHLSDELQDAKGHAADMQRKLAASQERCDQLNHQKVKLEEQLSQLISTSGDNSEQLSHMNESIKSRDKQIEKLQSDLQKVKQQSDEFELKTEQLELHNQNEIATLEERSNQEKQILLDKLKSLDEQLQDASKRLTLADSSNLDDELNKKSAELEKTKEALGKKEKELVQLNVKLQESELKADCNSDQFKKIQVELQQSKQVLENYKQDSEKQLEKSTSRLTQINADKEQAIFEKDESLVNLKKVEELLTDLKKENAIILKEKDAQTTLVNDKDIKVLALKEEVNRLNSEFNSHKEDLRKKLEEQQLESGAVSGLSEQLKQYHKQMQELQDDFLSCEKQNQDLRADVERLCEYESQKIQLEEECIMLKKQLEIMKERENKALFEYKSENNSLQQMLDSSQMQMGQQKRNLEGMQSQLNTIQSEKMCVMTNEVKTLKEDKHKLLNELKDLHSLLSQYKNNSNETTPEITTLQELKESSEAQIEFLNSVIVDMQKKNDDLTSKVEILETGVTLDSSDINLNGIRTAVVAPRLFCDICDVFDLHDTDDCPKQAMSDSPPPTKHHGERNQQRPYCEVCEVFGHDTKECDDAETF
ncbi:CAP-Gly domain-containing linker protein 1 [Nymphon striatum]|nr:CAP-Gly domain-containing linker protein 1 [Nymphon striatum]